MNIVFHIILTIIAIICGQCAKHIEKNLIPLCLEKINFKEFFKNLKKDFKMDIKYSLINILLFNLIYFLNGNQILTYIYISIIPILLIVFSIDYKITLIPDEAHLYIIIISIINILFNIQNIFDFILGAIVGGGIFFLIAYLSRLLLKKEGMGFGDVKLMASLGLLLGVKNILVVSLLSFFIGAVVGIILLLTKKMKKDSYIPFGPFIVISVFIIMFVKSDSIIEYYIAFCSFLGTKVTDLIYYFIK